MTKIPRDPSLPDKEYEACVVSAWKLAKDLAHLPLQRALNDSRFCNAFCPIWDPDLWKANGPHLLEQEAVLRALYRAQKCLPEDILDRLRALGAESTPTGGTQ